MVKVASDLLGIRKVRFGWGLLCYCIKSKNDDIIMNKYLYYYLSCFNEKILSCKNEGGTPSVNASDLANIIVIFPNIKEQKQIVSVLDHFSTLCTDLTSGLPRRN